MINAKLCLISCYVLCLLCLVFVCLGSIKVLVCFTSFLWTTVVFNSFPLSLIEHRWLGFSNDKWISQGSGQSIFFDDNIWYPPPLFFFLFLSPSLISPYPFLYLSLFPSVFLSLFWDWQIISILLKITTINENQKGNKKRYGWRSEVMKESHDQSFEWEIL